MSRFDVWIIRFEPAESSPAERLRGAFGIDPASATALAQSVPKIVKHAVPAKAAGEMRQALEAIGAVVECRPARDAKPQATNAPAVFRPPDADLFPPRRVSAIDPFESSGEASRPRISIDDGLPAVTPRRKSAEVPSEQPPKRITASLLATSRAQQRGKFLQQAIGMIVAGVAIISIGWFFGSSVFRGEADWIGIGFDGLGIYFVGLGIYDLVTTLRS